MKRHIANLGIVLLLLAGVSAVTITELGAPRADAANRSPVLSYELSNLPAGTAFQVTYSGGVTSNTNGYANANRGGFSQVAFVSNFGLDADAAPKAGALYGSVGEVVGVNGPKITGIASVPAGATVTLLNTLTDQTIDIPDGPFTIDSGQNPTARVLNVSDQTARCQGSATSCGATVDIAGPAGKHQVTITLPRPSLGLESVRPGLSTENTGFYLADGHLSDDRARYVVDVDTLQSEPAAAQLRLNFGSRGRP